MTSFQLEHLVGVLLTGGVVASLGLVLLVAWLVDVISARRGRR